MRPDRMSPHHSNSPDGPEDDQEERAYRNAILRAERAERERDLLLPKAAEENRLCWCSLHRRMAGSCFGDVFIERDSLKAQLERAREDLQNLARAVTYTTELYAEPLRYETGVKADGKANRAKKLKPNLSIGFETRYQQMYEKALLFLEAPSREGEGTV